MINLAKNLKEEKIFIHKIFCVFDDNEKFIYYKW